MNGTLANRTVDEFFGSTGQTLHIKTSNLTCFGVQYDSPTVCNGNGTCTRLDTCTCSDGYTGETCLNITCFGVPASNDKVCSGQGICFGPNKCKCEIGFEGDNCQQRVVLWDLISSQCHSGCTLNKIFWEDCLLTQGSSCYCNYSSPNVAFACSNNQVTEIDLSGNELNYPRISEFLPSSIERIIFNNISNSQPASILDFDKLLFPNLTEISLDGNSLCGPYPNSWKSNINISLKNHSKTLWCDETISEACSLLAFNEEFQISSGDNKTFSMNFTKNCDVDYSKVKCGKAGSFVSTNSTIQGNQLICSIENFTEIRNHLFLKFENSPISKNISIYKLRPQFINYLNGTITGIIGENLTAQISLETGIAFEIQHLLECYSSNVAGTTRSIQSRDDAIECEITLDNDDLVDSGNVISLKYGDFQISLSPLYVNLFERKSFNSSSLLGFSNQENEVLVHYGGEVARFSKHEITLSVNGSFISPDAPEITSSSTIDGYLSFSAHQFYKSVYKNGKYWDAFPITNPQTVKVFGNNITTDDIVNSPYLVYKMNFNATGEYFVFHDSFTSSISGDVTFYIGTNYSTKTEVIRRQGTTGFFPTANQKETAPRLIITKKGINYLNLWRGNGSIEIKRLTLFKTNSLSPLNLLQGETVVGTFDSYKTKLFIPKAGISKLDLLWKNSQNNKDVLSIGSNSLEYASVDAVTVLGFYPNGALQNENFTLTIYSNTHFTQYNGLVEFYCQTGNFTFKAIHQVTNFHCAMNFNITQEFVDVSLIAEHVTTGEKLLVSSNPVRVYLYRMLSQPRIFPLANNQTVKSTKVTITTSNALPLDFSRVLCRHILNESEIFYYQATREDSTKATCVINLPTIKKLNVDESLIGLWVNTSTSVIGDSGFYLTPQNLSHIVVVEPITSTLPYVLFGSKMPYEFSLNMSKINAPYLFNASIGGISTRFQDSNCTSPSNCQVNYIKVTQIPASVHVNLRLSDGYSEVNFIGEDHYYTQNVTLNSKSPDPFLMDPFKTRRGVGFLAEEKFNEDFQFYCIDSRIPTQSEAYIGFGVAVCVADGRSKDEIASFDIYILSNITELNNTLVVTSRPVYFEQVRLSPVYIEKSQIVTFKILNNDTSNFTVPTSYRSNEMHLRSNIITTWPDAALIGPPSSRYCLQNDTETTCTNGLPIDDYLDKNIYYIFFFIKEGMYKEYLDIKTPTLVYKSNNMAVLPHASLIGANLTFVVDFESNTFIVDARIPLVEYYCKANDNLYVAQRMNDNQMNCSIPYLGLNEIFVTPYIRVPSVSDDILLVSKNVSVVNYINQTILNFKNPTQPLYYTHATNENISLIISTELPISLFKYLKCSLKTEEFYESTILLDSSFGNDTYVFNCTFKKNSPGRFQAFIEYKEGNERFSLSTNSLDFIFTGKYTFTGLSPAVGITNFTNNIRMFSTFPARDYGNAQFITKFGFISDPYYNNTDQTNYTTVTDKFEFTTDLFVEFPNSYVISLHIMAFGKQLEVLPPVAYKVIDSNFFTPNHALVSGGEIVKILKPKSTNKDVVIGSPFNIDHLFNCSFVGIELVCTTPTFNSTFKPFNSYPLFYHEDGESLSAKFILYEVRRMISVHPTIVPFSSKSPEFSLNITLDKITNFIEGALIIKLENSEDVKDIEFGKVNHTTFVYMDKLKSNDVLPTKYQIKLNYKNTESLAFNEQFTFTENSINLTFVDVDATIGLSNCKNTFNVNETVPVEVTRQSPIISTLSSFVRCKLGNTYLPTTRVSDSKFICNVTSLKSGVEKLSLWYVNNDTLNNEMLISPNHLTFIFIDKIEIFSVDPYTSLIQTPIFATLFTNFKSDVFAGNVSYRCKFGNEFSSATLQGNGEFKCNIQTTSPIAKVEYLTLQLKSQSCNEWIDFSNNTVEFIYRMNIQIFSIYPFAKGYSNETEMTFPVHITIQGVHTVVNNKGLICRYNSSLGTSETSPTIVDGKNIYCNITKSNLTNQVEYLHVGLSLNTTEFSNGALISDIVKVVFFKEPLSFKNMTIFDNSLNQNFEIDLQNFTQEFDYKINFIESNSYMETFPCTKSSTIICKPAANILKPEIQPTIFKTELVVTKFGYAGMTALKMNPVIYHEKDIKITSMVPYVASYRTHSILPINFKLVVGRLMNLKHFNYSCITSGNIVLSPATVTYNSNSSSLISCNMKSRNKAELVDIYLQFSYASMKFTTSEVAKLNFVDSIAINNYHGFKTGGTQISFNFPTTFPTAYKTDYQLTFKYRDYFGFNNLDCRVGPLNGKYDCVSPAVNTTSKYPRNVQFSVYIDGEFAINLNPQFKYLEIPSISKVLPSRMVDIFTTAKTIQLESNAFVPNIQNAQYKIKYVELGQIRDCFTSSSFQISCPISKDTTNVGKEVTMQISIDGENFETLDKKLYLYTNDINSDKSILLAPNSITPNIISNGKRENFTISMNIENSIVLPVNEIYVRLKGKYIDRITSGIIQNNKIICEVPHFAKLNLKYPRALEVDVSFDGIQFFGQKQKLEITGYEKVDFYPKVFTPNEKVRFSFFQFPSLKLEPMEVIFMKLISQSTTTDFNCTNDLNLCESSLNSLPIGQDFLTIELYIRNQMEETKIFVPLIKNTVSVYPKPTISFSYKKISRNMKNMIFVNGNGFTPFKESIKIRGFFDGKFVNAEVEVSSNRIGFIFPMIKRSLKTDSNSQNRLEISYSGINFETFAHDVQLIEIFTFDQIEILDPYLIGVTFSFQNTTLNLVGTNLNGSAIVKLTNPLFSYSVMLENMDSSKMAVKIPEFKFYSPVYPFSFPVPATLGISFDDGVDFETRPITISDKFSSIFLVGIFPTIGSRISRNITMKGANFGFVTKCEFRDSNSNLISKVDIIIQEDEIICPLIYDGSFSHNEIYINLFSKFNDTSDQQKFSFVENPFPQYIYPSTGPAAGNYSSIITGEFDTRFQDMYLRVSQVTSEDVCKIINATAVECKVVAHANSVEKFELSYNRIEWYSTIGNFTYLPCPPGFGTESYAESCKPCRPGQFKSKFGIEVCTNCPINTFTDSYQSTNCTPCPNKMKSPGSRTGLNSIDQCVCVNNTMAHPTTGVCIDCPTGAICSPENVTFPKSQKGWWFSRQNILIFYQCNPAIRCLPETPDNCTEGYEGLRCGRCSDGYYKSKLICKKCNDRAITALTLVVAVIIVVLIMIIAAFFVLITSTKISQMTSISITFGYWQIISTFAVLDIQWPTVVDGTLSAASTTNFNFDFLAPECIFRIFGLQFNYFYVYFSQISMPFIFLIAFIFIYLLIVVRSMFAAAIGYRISKCLKMRYTRPYEVDLDEEEVSKIKRTIKSIFRKLGNVFILIKNFTVWSIRQKSTLLELRRILNKIVGAYFSFISFFFLRIMTTSFTIFGCDWQPNGIYTLKESPDITCYRDIWFVFLPLSIISIILFGLGSVIYFLILIINYKRLENNETFISINKFSLSKYKKKYFFWDLFDSVRKASFSILTVFFKPMFLITVGIGTVFAGMMLHVHFIPYRKKFHNLMEYFILMSTLLTLFAGLLLFVVGRDGGATNLVINVELQKFLNTVLPIITVVLIIGSNVVVISMFIFDVFIRRSKESKKMKMKRKIAEEENIKKQKLLTVLDDLHGSALVQDDEAIVPWETEHDFKFTVEFEVESDVEDTSKSINDILEDVFSYQRIKRNIFKLGQKAKSTGFKIARKLRIDQSRFEMMSPRQSIDVLPVREITMPNGFVIKTAYKGNVRFIQTSSGRHQNRFTVDTRIQEVKEEIEFQ